MSSESMGAFTVKFVGNTSPDGHTTYIIKVTNAEGVSWNIQKRYREIRELHDDMRLRHGDSLPSFPGKRIWGNQDPAFIAARQAGLEQYLQGVIALEREGRSPELLRFLGAPAQTVAAPTSGKQFQQILDSMQGKLLNLALPPAPLDETETAQRLKKYGDGMRISVLSQPVDPVILRDLGLDSEPVRLCPRNADNFEALKAAPSSSSTDDSKLLSGLLDDLREIVRPAKPIADPDKIVVPFPQYDLPSS